MKPFLAFLLRYEIRKLAVDGSWESDILRKVQNAVAIDFDWAEQRVYWTEGRAPPRLKRAFFNGTGTEVILETGLSNVEGLAVDWVGRNVYLADRVQDKIFVATLEGRYMKTLISKGLQEPRAVVVDPSDGMFNVSSKYQFNLLITIHFLIFSFENVFFDRENIAFYHFPPMLVVIVQLPSL